MALMTDDCVFEDTTPPDGRVHRGRREVAAVWRELFAATRDPCFEFDDVVVDDDDRAVQCWTFRWTSDDGGPDHVRGVDVLRVRDGRVADKRSYVEG